jgi:hypothetical protein
MTERNGPVILTNSLHRPWTADGFTSSWGKLSDRAGIDDLSFHDLRGTAVVRWPSPAPRCRRSRRSLVTACETSRPFSMHTILAAISSSLKQLY